jgi:hypothetical protein
MNALLRSAQILFSEEEYVGGMGQKQNHLDVAVKDAGIKLNVEEFALGTVQRSHEAAQLTTTFTCPILPTSTPQHQHRRGYMSVLL